MQENKNDYCLVMPTYLLVCGMPWFLDRTMRKTISYGTTDASAHSELDHLQHIESLNLHLRH